ncbi:MAG TPA: 23S rRNA (uridine(2552)-2'-O)-methyltransferase RlmE [Ectothiorhodospiraceae bacterium]|nr:23S rRNA (uridine(2552)-2'-O)-methyltransferase RlmE [Ectothiorhodospiraceae bacterium]
MAKRSKTSKKWLDEHFSDEYVLRAQQEGYRSRACYKLLEINKTDRLLKAGMTVVDLGAAPGSWSQIAANLVGHKGKVVALDILEMDPIPDVDFVHGDFREDAVLEALMATIDGRPVDLVMSDMAPNTSGVKAIDQPRSIYLCELALELALLVLKPGGNMVIKVFHGEGFDEFLRSCLQSFTKVVSRKPEASRNRSREIYLVAQGRRI